MNVQELIEALEDMDPQAEVRMATQPNWPMQHQLAGVVPNSETFGEEKCDEHEFYNCDECAEEADQIVYLVEGGTPDDTPYASSVLWEIAG